MKRTLLMASIAFMPTLAMAQSVLPERPIIVAQNEKPAETPDTKKPQPEQRREPQQRQEQRQEQRQQPQVQQPQQQQRVQQPEQPKPPVVQQPQAPKPQVVQPQQQQKPETVQPAQKPQTVQPVQQPQNPNRVQQPSVTQPATGAQKQNPAADVQKPAATTNPQDRRGQPQDTREQKRDDRKDTQRQDNQQDNRQQRQDTRQDNRQGVQQNSRQGARQERPEDRNLNAVRAERKETKQGNQTVIRERDRTIIREGNRTIVRHDDEVRFKRDGANVQEVRRGNNTERVIVRPGGVRIVTTVDSNGRTLRRSRFVNGREYVLFTNRPSAGFGFIVNLGPPVIRIPRERYIVEYRDAPPPLIYDTLIAEPVMPLERAYSLDEVRYNYDVRARMPRIDIDSVNFETGSWDVSQDQGDKLAPIAEAMKRAIQANPNEVFMVEGHTDAVGGDDDNLLLSDRRAQAVTEILTEDFGVPPENMIPQGYGEQNLKVETDGPEARNRYVSVRRVTPLLAQQR